MCTLPAVQLIMSPHTAWSGTYYSFTLDEPYVCFLICHLYLTYLYLPFTPEIEEPDNHPYKFPQDSEVALTPHITPHSPRTPLHHIALPCNPTVFTLHT